LSKGSFYQINIASFLGTRFLDFLITCVWPLNMVEPAKHEKMLLVK